MSRLLAYIANDPQRIRCVLHPGRALLVQRPGGPERAAAEASEPVEPIDGWGIGFYQGGEVLLQRRPKPPAATLDFYELVRDLRTDVLIGHMRSGTYGAPKNENTHPFRFRSWLFAHHGSISGFDEFKPAFLDAVPDFLRRNIRGQTDSEHLFHLFLAGLHQVGKLDDPMIPTKVAGKALADAIALTGELTGGRAATLDVAVTNGRILLATRRGRPLYYYKLDGVRDCPVCREAPSETGGRADHTDHDHLRAVVLVANGAVTGGVPAPWQEIPEGSLVTVSHELHLETAPL